MHALNNIRHRISFLLIFIPFTLFGQNVTLIAKHGDGSKDTVHFGFVNQASLGEDVFLGENNIFNTPVNNFEARILQRDADNHVCSRLNNGTKIYYPENFDSKINYRNASDTSIENRLFEVWFSDNQIDSIKIISSVILRGFLEGTLRIEDCDHDPPAPIGQIVFPPNIKTFEYKVEPPTLGHKEFIFIALPQDVTTSTEDKIKSTPEIKIHPNPLTDHFIVHNKQGQVDKIIIQNLHGQILEIFYKPQTNQEISVRSIASGIYVVHVWIESGHKLVQKVIKQ